jgi:hypothetical protein
MFPECSLNAPSMFPYDYALLLENLLDLGCGF